MSTKQVNQKFVTVPSVVLDVIGFDGELCFFGARQGIKLHMLQSQTGLQEISRGETVI